MLCPYCQTENRDDQETCYHCERDLTMLRLIVNKAKHHYNQALELADRGRNGEAIAEMKNALDLDVSMVNAHVVLGSLYAKEERFDEARESWARAIALDHRFQKAHEYLEKVDRVEAALPAVNRLKKLSAGLGGAAALFFLTTVLFATFGGHAPVPEDRPPQTAFPVQTTATQPAPVIPSAASAKEMAALKKDLNDAQQSLRRSEGELATLQTEAATLRQRLEATQTEIGEMVQSGIQDAMQRHAAGDLSFDALMQQFDRALALMQGTPLATELTGQRDQLRTARRDRELADARQILNDTPLDEALPKIMAIREAWPELAAPLDNAIDEALKTQSAQVIQSVRELADAGRREQAQARIDALMALYATAGRDLPTSESQRLAAALDTAQLKARQAEATAAFEQKEWERFLTLSDPLEALVPDASAREPWAAMRTEAGERWAADQWDWFQKEDPRFSDMSLSTETAERAVAIYRATLERLPNRLAYARGPILYYGAVAFLRLDQPQEARKIIDELDAMERLPNYIRKPIATLKTKHAGPLGLTQE